MTRSRGIERWLGLLILGGCMLVAMLALGGGEGVPPQDASSASVAPAGRGALYALLRELGLPAREWRRPPGELPKRPALLWLPRAPDGDMPRPAPGPGGPARIAPRTESVPRTGVHDLAYYLDFLEAGGTLLMTAGAGTTRFLVDDLELEPPPELASFDDQKADAWNLTTSSGEHLRVTAARPFETPDASGGYRVHWTVDDGAGSKPFLLSIAVGAGRVALLADDRCASNAKIGEGQNALAAVRVLEELDPGSTILFGEYELGRWDAPSTVSLALGPATVLVTLHALALLALFAWGRGHARAFPRDPEPHEMFSPLQRAQGLAGAFDRSGRHADLAALARRATLVRLAARARVRLTEPPDADASTRAFAPVTEADVAALAARPGLAGLAPRMTDVLIARRVAGRDELAALDRELLELEHDVATRLHVTGASEADAARTSGAT